MKKNKNKNKRKRKEEDHIIRDQFQCPMSEQGMYLKNILGI